MRDSIENFNAIKKRLLEELVEGRETVIQLQTLLHKPVKDEGPSVSGEEQLAMKILRSFTEGLSMVTSCTAASAQIAPVDCVGGGAGGGSTCTGGRNKKTVKDRRGCYKRKRSSDSWTTVSPTTDDGRAWRKYGQKDILNTSFPRCYYRCSHKPQGCKATKHIQKIKGEPLLYQTTYFNHHTCSETLIQLPQLILESDPNEQNLLSFRPNLKIASPKQKSKEDVQMACFPHLKPHGNSNPSTSSWPGIMETGSIGSKQHEVWSPGMLVSDDDLEEAVSGLYSCASMTGSQHGLDMEVNQLSDINFDEI